MYIPQYLDVQNSPPLEGWINFQRKLRRGGFSPDRNGYPTASDGKSEGARSNSG